jgi:hypothetical protein
VRRWFSKWVLLGLGAAVMIVVTFAYFLPTIGGWCSSPTCASGPAVWRVLEAGAAIRRPPWVATGVQGDAGLVRLWRVLTRPRAG